MIIIKLVRVSKTTHTTHDSENIVIDSVDVECTIVGAVENSR